MKVVSVYGDSLLKGVSLVGNKYTVCVEKTAAFAQAHGLEVLNRSCFGATVEKGLRRLDRDIADRDSTRAVCPRGRRERGNIGSLREKEWYGYSMWTDCPWCMRKNF